MEEEQGSAFAHNNHHPLRRKVLGLRMQMQQGVGAYILDSGDNHFDQLDRSKSSDRVTPLLSWTMLDQ